MYTKLKYLKSFKVLATLYTGALYKVSLSKGYKQGLFLVAYWTLYRFEAHAGFDQAFLRREEFIGGGKHHAAEAL